MKFTDQHCVADPLVESDSGMLAFPWVTKTASGVLVMAYHDGVDGPTGTSRIKTSSDQGATWTTGRVVWDENMATGAQVAVLPNGDWLLTSQVSIAGTHAGVYTKRSTDGGVTWAASQFVTNTACSGGTWTSTAPTVLANGALLWPVYGSDGGNEVSKVLISLDQGATWAVAGTVLSVPGVDSSETTLQQLPSGSVVALTRCSDYTLRRTVSADGGYTWSTPQAVTSGVNSRVDWIKTMSGRCLAGWRDSASSCEMATWSDDDMATVATPVQIHGPDNRTSYSALIEVKPGQVLAIIGEIDDGEQTGRIMSRYLLDTVDGMTPTGQTTYLDAQRLASGDANILAWDAFRRPDNAHGLGSADSGHQWMEYGGTSSDDWKLVGGTATNTNSTGRIHSVTLNTGNSDGYVEADLWWSGSTSSPLGLCARRSTATGHALLTKLDASGTTLRICYFDGANLTDLITPITGLHYGPSVWHRWRLLAKDNYVRVFIDQHEAASYILTSTDVTNLSGGTRWGVWGGGSSGATYKFKNFIASI